MAIGDLLTTYGDAIAEIITLAVIITGFFKWYDSKYSRIVNDQKQNFERLLNEFRTMLHERIEGTEKDLERIQGTLTRHLEQQR